MDPKDDLSLERDLHRLQSVKLRVADLRTELLTHKSTLSEQTSQLSSLPPSAPSRPSLTQSIARLHETINSLEREYDRAMLHIHNSHTQERTLHQHRARRTAAHADTTRRQLRSETAAPTHLLSTRHQELSHLEASAAADAAYIKQNLRAVQAARHTAAQRVRRGAAAQRAAREELEEVQRSERERRKRAVVELKVSSGKAVQEVIGGRNRAKAREERVARAEEAEFAELAAAGENPYEVFRRRRMEREAEAEKLRLRRKIAAAEMAMVEETIAFEEYCVKKEKEEDREAALQKVKGRQDREREVSEYMRSRTLDGQEVIDPTGRAFQVHPSKVTAIKPLSFGLGRAPEHITAAVAEKFPEVEPSQVTAKATSAYRADGSATTTPAHAKAAPPGLLERSGLGIAVGRREASGLVDLLPDGADVKEASGSDATTGAGRKYKQRQRSALEDAYLARARAAQLGGLTSPQVVLGKTFEGTAFLAKPETVLFEDFEVGKEYTKTFTLTNVSYTFNSFKLDGHGLPEEWRNFFTIRFKQAGRMSAGMTCSIKVTFSPKLNQDINTGIAFIANTGRFTVPLRCTIRRFLPSISPASPLLPATVIGEKSSKTIVLTNSGAINTDLELTRSSSKGPESAITIADSIPTHLPAYSECKLRFNFSPTIPNEEFHQSYSLSFKDVDHDPLVVHISGKSTDVPVYIPEPEREVDLRCCVTGKLYRTRVTFYNRATVGLKIHLRVPPELAKFLDISPKSAVIQARDADGNDGSFGVQVKLRPTTELLQVDKFVSASRVLHVGISVTVAGQTLPVTFSLGAQLSSGALSISPAEISLGSCYTSHAVRESFTLKNHCMLPQRFGFINTDKQLQVIPPFGTLLPLQEQRLQLVFQPFAEAEVQRELELRCDKGPAIPLALRCTGKGLDPPLMFSQTFLHFPATSLGSQAFLSTWVRNSSKEALTLHFVLPHLSKGEVAVAPSVCRLKPKASQRIEFAFSPAAGEDATDEEKVDREDVGYSVVHSRKDEAWSKHLNCTAVCFIRGGGHAEYLPMWLAVKATAVATELAVNEDNLRFSQVAVGCEKTLIVRVKNVSSRNVQISSEGLNAIGPFAVVNAFRTVAPGCSLALKVKFSPELNMKYSEVLVLRGDTSRISLRLTGEGVRPKVGVKVAGEAVESIVKSVDFGMVFMKETRTREFQIVNFSDFPVRYALDPLTDEPIGLNGVRVFTPAPIAAEMKAGEEGVVAVAFTPDHARNAPFEVGYTVSIPNQVGQHVVRLRGACSAFPLVVAGCEAPMDSAIDDPLALFLGEQEKDSSSFPPLLLELKESEQYEKTITIESCSQEHGGSFEFKELGSLSVDASKGSLKPEESKRILISCAQSECASTDEWTVRCVLTSPKFADVTQIILVRRMEE